jgi:hypothetical protein
LHARDLIVVIADDDNVIAYICFGDSDVQAAVEKVGHEGKLAAAAREEILSRHRH